MILSLLFAYYIQLHNTGNFIFKPIATLIAYFLFFIELVLFLYTISISSKKITISMIYILIISFIFLIYFKINNPY